MGEVKKKKKNCKISKRVAYPELNVLNTIE